ncbi:MAG: T9SS type A sorting domain-containing protein [Flavobacteriales bacterium]|nr:T9SS type A sorting domain-containing protein [Flavobacteriales bacterium]
MKYFLTALFLSIGFQSYSQSNFELEMEEVTLPNAPELHSFVVGQHDGKWLLIGGRTDGLHQRQPFAAFLATANNVMAYVVDPATLEVWSTSISSLPTSVYEQLQSTNMEFVQRDTVVYVTGGYGYSATAGDHITHANLTAVNVPTTINRIINGGNISNQIRTLNDANMAVTGGYLGLLDNTFYLVGGQYFEGRYNPMGPNNGPGFIQEYSDAIRKFTINDNGSTLSISNFTETVDAANLHRRDYNMVAQVFPNGTTGFTVFSGVFQPTVDLPWHNTVDVTASGYTVNNSFDQLLNQYHSAHLPIFDAANNEMHTIFFGGISRYYYDANGNLVDDQNVPFVKTVSLVTRQASGSMSETRLELQMPGFLGSGAEFIPLESVSYLNEQILELNALQPDERTLVGYIHGGIESSLENIFFINDGSQSWASGRLFKVYITATNATGVGSTDVTADDVFELESYPNPATQLLNVTITSAYRTIGTVELLDTSGKLIHSTQLNLQKDHSGVVQFDCSKLANGNYSVRFSNGAFSKSQQVIIAH